jgi:selenocysteine-specific elongation factor
MHVIGTAGHVDHGKSTLITALTGINPDRLKEEQARSMTIDLGFAWMTLPSGEEIGIVDVPGHRDFIENMLSGISGLDAVLLVIAADEGVMPQTREHLAILDLMQVQHGIVLLTKIDLVDDPTWLDMVESDVKSVLQGTFLQGAPILRVSSRTGQGFPELLQSLELLIRKQPARPDLSRPRLPIDRIFSMPGFGTIVTGTLSDGTFSLGTEVEILPSGLHARIRGLQTHKRKLKIATPGSRLAINLSGVGMEKILRGHVVTLPSQYVPTQRMDVLFHLLPDVSTALHHHTEVKLFIGASETIADLRLLGLETLDPGGTGWLQLELRAPVIAVRGDHYILRRPSPGETLGGGIVVDPLPAKRHKRFDRIVLNALERMIQGSPAYLLLQNANTLGPASIKDIVERSHLEQNVAKAALQDLMNTGQLILLENVAYTSSQWSSLRESILVVLSSYHKTFPLRQGMPREELKSQLKISSQRINPILQKLANENVIRTDNQWVALPDHTVQFSPLQQIEVNNLLEQFALRKYSPPLVKECQAQVGDAVFLALLESGQLVAVSTDVIYRREDYDEMIKRIHATLQQKGQISLAEVRDQFNTSRRYAQALLEHLDAIGETIRFGDYRRFKKPNG